MSIRGSCLCGEIQFEASNVALEMAHCHCSMCRKFHGAAFSTFGAVQDENFHWLAGVELVRTFKANNGTCRQFCGQCGSSLTFRSADPDCSTIEFSLACVDDSDELLQPDAHVFLRHKVPWLDVQDDLEAYSDERP